MNTLKTIIEDLRADSNDEPNPVVSAQQQSERMNATSTYFVVALYARARPRIT